MEEKTTQKFVTIDGRRLAIQDEGDGVPTVVLEMGLGAAASFYDDIARQLATFTRVVWYDRAGLGHSDSAPTPRTIQDLVFDLHTLLHAAAIPGPYILAGHSMGGLTVRLYRELYPEEVAAIVLIDAAYEEQQQRLLATLPPEHVDEMSALAQLRYSLRVKWSDPYANEESIDNIANGALIQKCSSLGDTPLIVISRGRADRDPAKFPPGVVDRLEQTWQQMQGELAKLSTRSKHIQAENSGHVINKDEPEIIIQAIKQAVMQVRGEIL